MRFRKLRIAWSVVCGIACVLLIVLWIRSYSSTDGVVWQPTRSWFISSISLTGRICVITGSYENPSEIGSVPATNDPGLLGPDSWDFIRDPEFDLVLFPHWFPIALFTAFAAAPWLHWRFSLRTLLIATTLLALGLGLIAWSIR